MSAAFTLERNAAGRLVYREAGGPAHIGVVPVRAFPIGAPDEGLSIVSADSHELRWIERLADLDAPLRALIEAELAAREFVPVIRRLKSVSTFSTPSTWEVETDRGDASFVLKVEEDIRRIGRIRLLIGSGHGLQYAVPDISALDRPSRKLLERFL